MDASTLKIAHVACDLFVTVMLVINMICWFSFSKRVNEIRKELALQDSINKTQGYFNKGVLKIIQTLNDVSERNSKLIERIFNKLSHKHYNKKGNK